MAIKGNIENNNHILLNKRYYLFFYFLFISQFKEILLNYFEDNYQISNLNEHGSIIDITDYHSLYLLITTEKNIYIGMPPNKTSETTSDITDFTSAATYDNEYVLLACTGDYLLSKVNIYTGDEVPLVNYTNLTLSNEDIYYPCSISILNNRVYIGISQILENGLNHNFIKIGLINTNKTEGPILGDEIKILKYPLEYDLAYLPNFIYSRLLSCEVISMINNVTNFIFLDEPILVCVFLKFDNSQKRYEYHARIVNQNFSQFTKDTLFTTTDTLFGFRLQKINNTFIRYLITKNSYEIYLNSSYDIRIVPMEKRNMFLYKYNSGTNTFYYHNQYIFYI